MTKLVCRHCGQRPTGGLGHGEGDKCQRIGCHGQEGRTLVHREASCAERVAEEWKGRKDDLERLYEAYQEGHESIEDLGNLDEYGLGFWYEAPDEDKPEGHWRYQLSTGGPGDELRFFASTPESRCYRIEYWFLDWFDQASIDISKEQIALDLWEWFKEAGSTEHTQREALK